jgi:hypothetical protein
MYPDNEVVLIAEEIRQYFLRHPDASDTADGIKNWVSLSETNITITLVQEALNLLVEKGEILKCTTPDSQCIYSFNK